jgi:hypothetical protein
MSDRKRGDMNIRVKPDEFKKMIYEMEQSAMVENKRCNIPCHKIKTNFSKDKKKKSLKLKCHQDCEKKRMKTVRRFHKIYPREFKVFVNQLGGGKRTIHKRNISLKDLTSLAKKYNVAYKNKSTKKIAEYLSVRWRYMNTKEKSMISHLVPHKWFQDVINTEPIKMPKSVKDIEYPIMGNQKGGKRTVKKKKKSLKGGILPYPLLPFQAKGKYVEYTADVQLDDGDYIIVKLKDIVSNKIRLGAGRYPFLIYTEYKDHIFIMKNEGTPNFGHTSMLYGKHRLNYDEGRLIRAGRVKEHVDTDYLYLAGMIKFMEGGEEAGYKLDNYTGHYMVSSSVFSENIKELNKSLSRQLSVGDLNETDLTRNGWTNHVTLYKSTPSEMDRLCARYCDILSASISGDDDDKIKKINLNEQLLINSLNDTYPSITVDDIPEDLPGSAELKAAHEEYGEDGF